MGKSNLARVAAFTVPLLCLGTVMPSLAEQVCKEQSETLTKVRKDGEIRLGYRPASIPFSYLPHQLEAPQPEGASPPKIPAVTVERQTVLDTESTSDLPRGYSVDLCMQVINELMTILNLDRLEITFVAIDPSSRIGALHEKNIDLECGSTSITVARGSEVDFSHVIFVTGTKLLVRRRMAEEIQRAQEGSAGPTGELEIEDMRGRRIAVSGDTTNRDALEAMGAKSMIDVELEIVPDHEIGIDMLLAGEVDGYASDDILLYGVKKRLEDAKRVEAPDDLIVTGRFLSYDLYGLMMRQNESCFRWIVNKRLSDLFRSGEIGAIYERWFAAMNAPPSRLFRSAVTLQATPLGQ